MALLLALLGIIGIFATLGFGIANHKKTTWCVGLITSFCWTMFPFLAKTRLASVIEVYGHVFQPGVAHAVVSTTMLLMLVGGSLGVITCMVTAIKWYQRSSLKNAEEKPRINRKRHFGMPANRRLSVG